MKLLDILHEPWAITPAKKQEIDEIYATHLRGEKIDLAGIEAAIGKPLNNTPAKSYEVVDGIAVIELSGVMAKRMNLLTRISGGVSTQVAAQLLADATADPQVDAILLVVDSPGGAVDGTPDLANAVRRAAEAKPLATVADGVMASAAYWAGSAASKVYAASDTTIVGSIGVIATHVDVSGSQAKRGVKVTDIAAGTFKGIASENAPLSDAGRKTIQDQVDYLYGLFVSAVAQHRGAASTEAVHSQMADGRIFIGQQAVDAGLVDGIASVEAVMAMLSDGKIGLRPIPGAGAAGSARSNTTAGHGAAMASTNSQETHHMEPVKVTAEQAQPFVTDALAAQAKEYEPKLAAAREGGAKNERERIQGILALGKKMPGHEALIETMAFDGTVTVEQAQAKVIDAENDKRTARAKTLKEDAPQPVPAAAAPVEQPKADEPNAFDVAAKARTYIAEQSKLGNSVSAAQAVAHVTKQETK